MTVKRMLVCGSFADSLIRFRGPLLQAAKARGVDVHAAAPLQPEDGAASEALRSRGIKVHGVHLNRAGMNPLSDAGSFISLLLLMIRVRPDCFLGYTVKPVVYGALAAWLVRVPCRYVLITGLGYAFTGEATGKRRLIQSVVRFLYRLALARSSKVFFQNPDDLALFRRLGLLPAKVPAVVVNGSGVDIAEFSARPLPSGAVRFLMIARLLGDKGVREYVAAARQVKNLFPDAMFTLVGWIDDNPDAISADELQSWVNDGVVRYTGRLEDVRDEIADCSVYVLPSYREGTPRTVLEAMAIGRPVITTDAPGCRETVLPGENGFLVAVKDSFGLADAMMRFVQEPGLIETMSRRSREIVEQKYDVRKVNAMMLDEMGITP